MEIISKKKNNDKKEFIFGANAEFPMGYAKLLVPFAAFLVIILFTFVVDKVN